MSSSPSPYDAAIADVEARIDDLQRTLDTLRQLRAQSEGTPFVPAVRTGATGQDIPHDAFFGMTVAEATKKYLALTKQTKSTSEIATALEAGGLKHSSKSFGTTIRAILGPREEFTRVNGDWALAEWYPGKGRGRKPKVQAHKSSVQEREPPPTKAARRPVPHKSTGFGPGSLTGRSLALLKENNTKTFSAPEVSQQLGADRDSIAAALSTLFKLGMVTRPEHGRYQAGK
jgi:hypothetical protein